MYVDEEVFCNNVDSCLAIASFEEVYIVRKDETIALLHSSIDKKIQDEMKNAAKEILRTYKFEEDFDELLVKKFNGTQ